MKKTMKLLAALLAILMIVGMFAGCKKDPAKTTGAAGDGKHYLTATVVTEMRVGDWKDRMNFPVFKKFNEMLEARGLYVTWNVIERDQYKTFLSTSFATSASDCFS